MWPRIVEAVHPHFAAYADVYDASKYPPPVLDRLRLLFANPSWFQPEDIELALRWKYGHLAKGNYPEPHRALARRIATEWPAHRIGRDESPESALARWRALIGATSFVTTCFLLHLVAPDEWPILDQHNFRAVRHYLRGVGVSVPDKAAPSTAEDLRVVRDFVRGVRATWRSATGEPAPDADRVDRFLMVYGQQLKSVTKRPTIGQLFDEEPRQWGLRGDPFLWRKMRQHLLTKALPSDRKAVADAVAEAFERLTGKPITCGVDFYLEEFAHGGMSSGGISPEFWRDTAIPLLERRLEMCLGAPTTRN